MLDRHVGVEIQCLDGLDLNAPIPNAEAGGELARLMGTRPALPARTRLKPYRGGRKGLPSYH